MDDDESLLLLSDLKRLLHCMEHFNADNLTSFSLRGRAAMANDMFIKLLQRKKCDNIDDALRDRVHRACSMAEDLATKRKETEIDLIDEIFFKPYRRKGDWSASNREHDNDDDLDLDGGVDLALENHLESSTQAAADASDQNHASSCSIEALRRREDIEEIQKAQREQLESEISHMATQLKASTQRMNSTIRGQTEHLEEMEALATENVHRVGKAASKVVEHNEKSWRSTMATWTLMLTIVATFVFCLVTIQIAPKRADTSLPCLVNCNPNDKSAQEKARDRLDAMRIKQEEVEHEANRLYEEVAQREAEEAARLATEETLTRAEEAAQVKAEAEEEARRTSEEVRLRVEADAREEAEEAARREAEAIRFRTEKAAREADVAARVKPEEAARRTSEEVRRRDQAVAREEAEETGRRDAEAIRFRLEKAVREADIAARSAAEEKRIGGGEAAACVEGEATPHAATHREALEERRRDEEASAYAEDTARRVAEEAKLSLQEDTRVREEVTLSAAAQDAHMSSDTMETRATRQVHDRQDDTDDDDDVDLETAKARLRKQADAARKDIEEKRNKADALRSAVLVHELHEEMRVDDQGPPLMDDISYECNTEGGSQNAECAASDLNAVNDNQMGCASCECSTGDDSKCNADDLVAFALRIHNAAAADDVAALRDALQVKPEYATHKDENDWEPIHEAAIAGHLQAVNLLLHEYHVDVNARTSNGATSLWWARRGLPEDHSVIVALEAAGGISIGPE